MQNFNLDRLLRENIRKLKPYSSARSEYSGDARVFLDANENSWGSPTTRWYNRYPDPLQKKLKEKLSSIKNLPAEQMLLGNGSDECIDLLIRSFCEPGRDNIIIFPPTYGMYEVYADINNVTVKAVNLTQQFQIDLEKLEETIDPFTKIIFICSPNNPTGNSIYREDIEMILNNFDSLVVLDEAYINFSRQRSMVPDLKDYPNLVVMQTLSKAWGLAALRLGMMFASAEIISALNKVKPPYNIGSPSQEVALLALDKLEDVNEMIRQTVEERARLATDLQSVTFVKQIFPTDANFLLVRMEDANAVYDYLKQAGIIVRNRSNIVLCENALRITIGTPQENAKLLESLQNFQP